MTLTDPGLVSAPRVEGGEPRAPATPSHVDDYADVVVVGSGAAGIAAALAARELGAEVLVIDRDGTPGHGITYATRVFAAGTRQQVAAGYEDSPALAAEDWESITGVSGDTSSVSAFLEASAETLYWLVSYGLAFTGLAADQDSGSPPRLHQVRGEDTRKALIGAFDGEIRLMVEVDALVTRQDRVVGVRWTDLETGETGATGAGAVVVATGGFLRNRERVAAARPELALRRLLYETSPQADGGGLPFLEAVGAVTDNLENIGLYVHAIQDPELGEGEALILGAMDRVLLVDEAGLRFAREDQSRSLDFFDALPEGEITAIFHDALASTFTASRPDYNWADPNVEESYTLEALLALTDEVQVAASLSEIADAAGIDAGGLQSTVDSVNDLIEAGGTDEFGRAFAGVGRFEGELWWAVRLTPGLAKGFGGVSTDLSARALDARSEVIPGLYAVGELAGMIPGGGAGAGFSGSIAACYYGGRLAGSAAATEALARRQDAGAD